MKFGTVLAPVSRLRFKMLVKNTTAFGTALPNDKSESRSTLDDKEVARFGDMRQQWWDAQGPMKALHSMNKLRIPFIRDGLLSVAGRGIKPDPSAPLRGFKVLEIGCGGGILTEPLARLGAGMTGVEASDELARAAREHSQNGRFPEGPPTYFATTIEDHCRQFPNHYDAVIASEVIEHVADKELFTEACVASVKPGGSLFFTTPNRTLASWLMVIVGAEYITGSVPRGTHNWDQFITPEEIMKILEKNDCRTEVVHGMFYNVLGNTWTWCKHTDNVYALHARKSN